MWPEEYFHFLFNIFGFSYQNVTFAVLAVLREHPVGLRRAEGGLARLKSHNFEGFRS